VNGVSVVIVNRNSLECLSAAMELLPRSFSGHFSRIIVVDNASTESVHPLKKRFPNIYWIFNDRNLGFSHAVNQAVAEIGNDDILLLNPDAFLHEGSVGILKAYLDANPSVGIVGPRILNSDGTLQLSCRRSIPTPWVSFTRLSGLSRLWPKSRLFSRYNLTHTDPDATQKVGSVSGSCMLVRREAWRKLAGFDERFFLFGEDLDFCLRARQAGYDVIYHPKACVTHLKGVSCLNGDWPLSRYHFHRSMWVFYKKHFSPRLRPWDGIIWAGIWFRYLIEKMTKHPPAFSMKHE